MSETETKTDPKEEPKIKRVKLRAVQEMFDGMRIIGEGEVFEFVGAELPSKEIAVRAPKGAAIGDVIPFDEDDAGSAPPWTTPGYVETAHRAAGMREAQS